MVKYEHELTEFSYVMSVLTCIRAKALFFRSRPRWAGSFKRYGFGFYQMHEIFLRSVFPEDSDFFDELFSLLPTSWLHLLRENQCDFTMSYSSRAAGEMKDAIKKEFRRRAETMADKNV